MGQIAEDMIDGTACQWCGMLFQDPDNENELYTHGYPVICKECARDWRATKKGKKKGDAYLLQKLGLQVAHVDTI